MVYLTLLLSHRVAACDGGHDRQVPDLDDVRHRVPVHGGAVPHQGAERGGGDGVDLRKGGVHISALHRGPAGELKVTAELRSYTPDLLGSTAVGPSIPFYFLYIF